MSSEGIPGLKIKFRYCSDHRTFPASGAWGGPTPQGDIICNFYIEYQSIPDHLSIEFGKQSQAKKETQHREDDHYVREITTSVTLRPDIAISVGKWLIKQAEGVKEARQFALEQTEGTIQ